MKRLSICIMIGLLVLLGQGCILSSTPVSPLSIEAGDSVTFQVSVFPTNITVQWYVDDNLISGATDKSYIYSPDEGDIGTHTVIVKETSGCIFLGQNAWEVEVISADLIAYYPFNGNANDVSGKGNNGTVYGPVLTEDRNGNLSRAYEFDGVDDYIDLGNNSSLKPNLPISITAWVRLDSNAQKTIFSNDFTFNQDMYYGVCFGVGDSNTGFSYMDGGPQNTTSRRTKFATTFLDTGTWYHIAAVIRGPQDMDFYINGIYEDGTYDGTGGDLAYYGGIAAIGVYDSSDHNPAHYYDGAIDEVRVYKRALSAVEIEALFNFEK